MQVMVYPHPALPKPERKTRKTHKNSRDGCPNCKSKRIKCSEELPSCFNCIKKNYRCGYLDFPKEKLDAIRKKNAKKEQQSQQHNPPQSTSSSVNKEIRNPRKKSTDLSRPPPAPTTEEPPMQLVNDLYLSNGISSFLDNDQFYNGGNIKNKSPVLSDTPNNSEQLLSNYFRMPIPNEQPNESTPPNIFNNVPQDSFSYFNIPSDEQKPDLYSDSLKRIYHDYNIGFELPNGYSTESSADAMVINNEQTNGFNGFENNDTTAWNDLFLPSVNDMSFSSPSSVANGNPLPNAIPSSQTFRMLKFPTKLGAVISNKSYQKDKLGQERVKGMLIPMWTKQNVNGIWSSVFNKSIAFKVYFSFFMDCSLNVLLKVCNKSIHSGTNLTCFTFETLEQLTRKSYNYYGSLIKDLRESISSLDPEYSTMVSWYAGFSLHLHTHTTAESIALLYSGSSSLLNNAIAKCETIEEVPPTLLILTHVLKSDVAASMIPDYQFEVIKELYEDLNEFKTFINYNQGLTSENNGYILKAYIEVMSFLKTLIEEIYPKFVAINKSYKAKYNLEDKTNNLVFISPSMLFDLLVKWFNVIPSYACSIGERMTPLKKTFYLFYPAIGIALANVFPLLRCVALVDSFYMLYPHCDFNNKLYQFTIDEVSNPQQYQYLYNLSTKLIRIINFFTNRQQIINHYLQAHYDFGNCHLELVETNDDSSVHNIIRILPPKLDTKEIMLSNFGINTIINLNNYPMINAFFGDIQSEVKQVIEYENHAQKMRINQFRLKYKDLQSSSSDKPDSFIQNDNQLHDFDYTKGYFTFDYKIETAIQLYSLLQKKSWPQLTIESIHISLCNLELAMQEIQKSICNKRTK